MVAGVTGGSDLVGTARPQGAGLDRGAYEFVVAGDTTPPATPAAPGVANPTSARPILSGSSEAGATLRIYDNGILVGTVIADAAGAWSWTPATALGSGTHAFSVTASDAAGNTSALSPTSVVQVAGAVSAASPAGGGGGNGCGAGGMAALLALLAGMLACRRCC